MATIKSYTDIEQAKKLAEILPLESADAKYGYIAPYEYSDRIYDEGYDGIPYPIAFIKKDYSNFFVEEYDGELPCWSLAALLNVLPDGTDIIKEEADTENERYMCTVGINDDIISTFANNPVDVCVEMILKLKENKSKYVLEK